MQRFLLHPKMPDLTSAAPGQAGSSTDGSGGGGNATPVPTPEIEQAAPEPEVVEEWPTPSPGHSPSEPWNSEWCVQCLDTWPNDPWKVMWHCKYNCVYGKAYCGYCIKPNKHNCSERRARLEAERGTVAENKERRRRAFRKTCLLYTSDAADE